MGNWTNQIACFDEPLKSDQSDCLSNPSPQPDTTAAPRNTIIPQLSCLPFFSLRHNRQPARDRRGRDQPADAQHDQRAHPQPGARRPPLHRAVRAFHGRRLRPLHHAGLAVRTAVVQDSAVPHLHHQLLQHLHSHLDVHGQVSGRRVPGKHNSFSKAGQKFTMRDTKLL